MRSTLWIGSATGVVALTTALGCFAHVPHKNVALPPAGASPTDVVRTYVRAINDRDYATANAVQARGPVLEDHGWYHAPTIRHLEITHVTSPYNGAGTPASSVSSYQQVVEVDTEADFAH